MSQAAVAQAKAELQAEGADLSGPCGAFTITRRAAEVIGPPAGLLWKPPPGNQCESYAVDIVCYPDGHIWDCLIDGGGANTPAWQDKGFVEASRYRPVTLVPEPPDPPQPPTTDAVLARLDTIIALLQAILEELRTGG